jgi:hypothetical protein
LRQIQDGLIFSSLNLNNLNHLNQKYNISKNIIFLILVCFINYSFGYQNKNIQLFETMHRIGEKDLLHLKAAGTYRNFFSDQYLGAYYLAQDSHAQRLFVQITADKILGRAFQKHWQQGIQHNAETEILRQQLKNIQTFLKFFQNRDFVKNDIILIDYYPDRGTRVTINGELFPWIGDPKFFDLLLNFWQGQSPPSNQFQTEFAQLVSKK